MFKKVIKALFNKNEDSNTSADNFIVAQLNEKIGPIDRSLVYGDPLDEFLKEKQYGEVTGGGTQLENTGEIAYCDIEILLTSDIISESLISDLITKLESLGAPKGSKLIIERTNDQIPFGKKEGLAIYLDSQNLSEEVYNAGNINFVLSELHRLTNIQPDADRNWLGKKETALYFFNDSFEEMKTSISGFIATYPLCKGARIVQIA